MTPERSALRALLTSPTRSGGHVKHSVEEIIACDDFEQLAGKGGFSLAARGSPFLEQLQRSFVDLDTALLAWPPEAAQWPQAYLNQRARTLSVLSLQPSASAISAACCPRATIAGMPASTSLVRMRFVIFRLEVASKRSPR